MRRKRSIGHPEIIAVERDVQFAIFNVFAQKLLQSCVDTVGKQGAARLNADNTGIRKITPVLKQLMTKPLNGERKARAV